MKNTKQQKQPNAAPEWKKNWQRMKTSMSNSAQDVLELVSSVIVHALNNNIFDYSLF